MKNLQAKYIYAGYCIRKGFTIMTSEVNGRIVYDTFLYTYVDNFLSFFLKMDNGLFKSVDYNVEVPEAKADDLVSKHLARGIMKDTEDYEQFDKEQIVGVFGLRDISVLMKQVDEMKKRDADSFDVSLEAWLDVKPSYMGMEVIGVINTFNKCLKYDKGRITVPPIKYGPEDTYASLIGDEMDYFDFMSDKDSDEIVKELKALDDRLDGVGNLKKEIKKEEVKDKVEEKEEYDDIIDTL
ncbi:MAG: hypothetical protein K2H20_04675 [Bacilli bacterium]|nr:hypothetical protein [Bacilli bacterium]